jgi:hypothetical protein
MNRMGRGNSMSLKSFAAGVGLFTALVGWVSSAEAQGELRLGRTGSGALSATDPILDDDSHYDLWTFRGQSGQTIRVTLRSDAFDAYLSFGRMEGGEFEELEDDDDGAGGTDSKIVFTLEADNEYAIRVNSLAAAETGAYSVLVEEGDPNEISAAGESDGATGTDNLPDLVEIHAGQTLNGELESTDAMMSDTSRYDLYSFRGRRGQQVIATMRSPAFDSYLTLGRIESGSFTALESDDDSGGNEDSQVSYRITRDGEYALRANSLFKNVSGPYTMKLEMGVAEPPVQPTVLSIRFGQTLSSELSQSDPQMDDDSHYDLWKFSGKAGDKVVIIMKSSAFDTYVALGRMESGDFEQLESEDDGAGGTDSRLEFTLDRDGEYMIRANSLFSKGLGAYTLNLARGR